MCFAIRAEFGNRKSSIGNKNAPPLRNQIEDHSTMNPQLSTARGPPLGRVLLRNMATAFTAFPACLVHAPPLSIKRPDNETPGSFTPVALPRLRGAMVAHALPPQRVSNRGRVLRNVCIYAVQSCRSFGRNNGPVTPALTLFTQHRSFRVLRPFAPPDPADGPHGFAASAGQHTLTAFL